MRYIHSLEDMLVRVLFISSITWPMQKEQSSHKKKEQPTAAAQTSGVHNDQHRAVFTPYSTLCSRGVTRSLCTAAVYFSAFLRIRLTHSAVVSKAYVKRCNLNEITTPAKTDTKMSKLPAEHA